MFAAHKMGFTLLYFFYVVLLIQTSNWVDSWVLMEVLMVLFMININYMNQVKDFGTIFKYMTIQSGSNLIMMAGLCVWWNVSFEQTVLGGLFVTISLMIKSGLAPFHSWVVDMAPSLNWWGIWITLTFSKIWPLFFFEMILSKLSFTLGGLLFWVSILSGLLGGPLKGSHTVNTRDLLIYSSLSASSMVLLVMSSNSEVWVSFAMVYWLQITWIICSCQMSNFDNMELSTSFNSFFRNSTEKDTILSRVMILSMSLVGVPPLPGFFLKWTIFYVSMGATFAKVAPMMMPYYAWWMGVVLLLISYNMYMYMRMMFKFLLLSSEMFSLNSLFVCNKFSINTTQIDNRDLLWLILDFVFLLNFMGPLLVLVNIL